MPGFDQMIGIDIEFIKDASFNHFLDHVLIDCEITHFAIAKLRERVGEYADPIRRKPQTMTGLIEQFMMRFAGCAPDRSPGHARGQEMVDKPDFDQLTER